MPFPVAQMLIEKRNFEEVFRSRVQASLATENNTKEWKMQRKFAPHLLIHSSTYSFEPYPAKKYLQKAICLL